MRNLFIAAIVLLSSTAAALSSPIMPQSYTYDQPTRCGTWCYTDPNDTKLTDGVIGYAGPNPDHGQSWDGWNINVGSSVNIDFTFSSPVSINYISIGSTQDSTSDIVMPDFFISELVNGKWQQVAALINPLSSSNNQSVNSTAPSPFFTLSNLDTDSSEIRVTARAHGTKSMSWVFIDEVRFDGSPVAASVPEPTTVALLGIGLLGLVAAGRHQTCGT